MNLYPILLEVTVILAVITNLISMFMIKRKNLILFQLICNIFFTLNFLLEGVNNSLDNHNFDAMPCFLIVVLCSFLLMKKNDKKDDSIEKDHVNELITIIFVIFMIILIQVKYDDYGVNDSYFPLMASILVVYALMKKNIKIMKIYYLFVGLLWIAYDIYENNDIVNAYNQVLLIVSIIGSFLLYDVLKMEDKMQNHFSNISNYLKKIFYQLWK